MRHRNCLFALLVLCTAMLAGCSSLAPGDPLQVTVAGIDPLPGEGLELRLMVRLRLQNPNDAAVDYEGCLLSTYDAADERSSGDLGCRRGI